MLNKRMMWAAGTGALLIGVTAALARQADARRDSTLAMEPAGQDAKPSEKPTEPGAQEGAKPEAASGLPVSLAGFEDEGVFFIFKGEERIITIRYAWKPDGRYETDSVLAMAGQEVKFGYTITPDADGRFARIDLRQPQGPAVIERDGATVRLTFKEIKRTATLKPDSVLHEDYSPALMSIPVKRYDRAKGGVQSFPVYVLAAVVLEASLERIEPAERTIGGRDVAFERFTYRFPGVDMIVWADEKSKICFIDVPAQRAAYVREGYEALRTAGDDDPLISKPTFEVVEKRGEGVPMRDGLKLSTDLYLPKTDDKVPVVLIRTPYKKEMSELDAKFYARRGYAVAVQDVRGRFASPGEWEPFVNEKKDGYDTIEWLAAQPWSSGKVGMIGASYLGWVQWWAASENPPHLTTIIPNVSPPDPFYNMPYEYGAFFLLGAIWWADVVEQEATGDLSGVAMGKIMEKKFAQLLRGLPVIDLDKTFLGKESRHWRTWIEHNTEDDYWARASFLKSLDKVRIPVFHQSGWFDGDGIGSKLNYAAMVRHGHPHQKLILGPWGHQAEASRRLGDWDFGEQAAFDLPREYLRWFDYWLKGVDNGIVKEPLVRIFAMNSNVWLTGDTYPLPQTRFEKWYLSSGGNANTSKGDGKLSREAPSADGPPDRYAYDPGDPTPNPTYREETEEEEQRERTQEELKKIAKEHHESVTSQRRDILVYTSEPFDGDYTFAGPVSGKLFAASSAKDTDWFMRLLLVEPDGEVTNLVEGRLRARYRNSMSRPELLEPGKVYEYDLDLWQTGLTVKKGQRLRVEVASATFPFFSRNLNTGGHNEKETTYVTAEQTIHHDAQRPSHVLLPMIPAEKIAGKK